MYSGSDKDYHCPVVLLLADLYSSRLSALSKVNLGFVDIFFIKQSCKII